MLAWLTGSNNDPTDSSRDTGTADESSLDQPETPAPVFAMRAFKQALFGTPQPITPAPSTKPSQSNRDRKLQPSKWQATKEDLEEDVVLEAHKNNPNPKEAQLFASPAKPGGILMTPGTIASRRKQVTFGESVVDNEGKRKKYSKSGLPDNFPGKFPSPWTPKTTDSVGPAAAESRESKSSLTSVADKKVESKFKEILEPGKNSHLSKSTWSIPRSKDDGDVTVDLNLPRSASGRYWKEQYELYSGRSETETKRLIAKHKLAKDYARIKDEETDGLRGQLDYEQRKRQKREKSLEIQVKDMRERLRVALAENAKLTADITGLRMQVELKNDAKEAANGALHNIAPSKAGSLAPEKMENRAVPTKPADAALSDVWLDEDPEKKSVQRVRRLRRSTKNEQLPRQDHGTGLNMENRKSFEDLHESFQELQVRRPKSRGGRTPKATPASKALPLSDRDPNMNISAQRAYKSSAHDLRAKAKQMTPKHTHASIIQFDSSAPLEALNLQASQPTTPRADAEKSLPRQKTSDSAQRPESKLPAERHIKAAARVAEKKKKRRANE